MITRASVGLQVFIPEHTREAAFQLFCDLRCICVGCCIVNAASLTNFWNTAHDCSVAQGTVVGLSQSEHIMVEAQLDLTPQDQHPQGWSVCEAPRWRAQATHLPRLAGASQHRLDCN